MFLTKLKIAAALLLTLSVAGAGVGIFCRGVAAGPPRVDKDEPAGTRAMVVQVQSSPRKDSDVEQTLKRTVNIQFNDTPLGQVLALLADNFRLNMVVDHPALHEAAIAEDHPISMRLDGVALKTALQLMLHDAGLGYRVKDGIIIITTTSQRIVTKVYPVGDLVVFSDKGKHKEDKRTGEEKLIDLITKVVAPQTWSSMGGPATIEFFPLGLSLVINQEPAVHEQIEALLVGLRLFKERAR